MLQSFASKASGATGVAVLLATSIWRSEERKIETQADSNKYDGVQSFSPSPPLIYFHPNPDLEICFDTRSRTPVYALERLRPRSTRGNETILEKKQRRPQFVEETSIAEPFRSRNSHYRHSGFDRGHMAPAADFQFGKSDTFTLANACPQHPTLNRTLWNRLEQWVRRVAEEHDIQTQQRKKEDSDYDKFIMVLTGPLWLPASRGPNDMWEYRFLALGQPPSLVSVPTHFFKLVVVVESEENFGEVKSRILQYAAFCVPNRDDKGMETEPLEHFLVRWTDLEAVVGMQFFPSMLVDSGDSDQWRALADRATEDVWRGDRALILFDNNYDSQTKSSKNRRRGGGTFNADKLSPEHICRHGVCK